MAKSVKKYLVTVIKSVEFLLLVDDRDDPKISADRLRDYFCEGNGDCNWIMEYSAEVQCKKPHGFGKYETAVEELKHQKIFKISFNDACDPVVVPLTREEETAFLYSIER